MSLFNPIRSQYKRLEKVFKEDPALDLHYAARLMKVPAEKIPHSIQIMNARQYFAPDQPLVNHRLFVLIRDQRYLELASLKRKSQKLFLSLQRAGSADTKIMQAPGAGGRGRIFGSFVRDVVDSALGGSLNSGQALRSRTGTFLRDMMEPDHRSSIANIIKNDISGPLSMLVTQNRQLSECLSSRPDQEWNPELGPFLDKLTGIVDAWCSCVPDGQLPTDAQLRTADKLSDRLEYEFVPQFQVFLEDIYHPKAKEEQPPKSVPDEQDPVLANLEAKKRAFRNTLLKVKNPALQESGAVLDHLLGQIISELAVRPGKTHRASIRSLQNTYLPMMIELTEKYAENELSETPGPNIMAAMKTTEKLFENELPAALHRMLDDLHQDSAIDMVSQAEALRGKLTLDGLIK